jgi:hypothetical protein
VFPITMWLLVRRAGVDLRDVAVQAARPALAGVVSWVVSALLLSNSEWGPTWSMVTVTLMVLVIYVVIVGPQFRSLLGRSALPREEPADPVPFPELPLAADLGGPPARTDGR